MAPVAVVSSRRRASTAFTVSGAKHSFAHSLACAALAQSGVMMEVPDIEDSRALVDVLRLMFAVVDHVPTLKLLSFSKPKHPEVIRVTTDLTKRSRNILCLLPAMLANCKVVILEGIPSGCQLGERPIDWYLTTLRSFGVIVSDDPSRSELTMKWPHRRSASIDFDYPTMTGTVIAIAAAAIADGTSRITGMSLEPSCADQLDCLRSLGAGVVGQLPSISITGSNYYAAARFTASGDRIHAVTMITAAMLSRGEIEVTAKAPLRIPKFAEFLTAIGAEVAEGPTSFHARYPSDRAFLSPAHLLAGSEPLFSSDWAPFAALLLATCSAGISTVKDSVFPRRFQFAEALADNDLDIQTFSRLESGRRIAIATIHGKPNKLLSGGPCRPCNDIRGSAALLLSAIVSRLPVSLADDFHLSRGYEDLPADLEKLGVAEVIK